MEDKILYEVRERIAYITLNKPEVGNCTNRFVTGPVKELLQRAENDPEVGVIILTARGKFFSTGGDVPRLSSLEDAETGYDEIHYASQLAVQMVSMQKPIICTVHGIAAGAGLCLALASDFVVCDERTKFLTAFNNIALASDAGAAWLLTKTVGKHKAKEWLMLSDMISAEELKAEGIVTRIAPEGQALDAAEELAHRLLEKPAFANKLIKNMVNRADDMTLEASLLYEEAAQAMLMQTSDFKEGCSAFMEKRKAEFGKR